MSNEIVTTNPTAVVSGDALSTLERASIDMQIATAHQYPRSMTQFKQRAIAIACLDEDTAISCIYRRPVGKQNGQQVYAEGMSVRMAEIVASCYGNLRVAARIVEQDPGGRFIVAQGVAHDLESNVLSTSEVIEATVYSNGRPYDERMRIVVTKAALAKARRDAIFQVVPKALAKPIELAVKDLLTGGSTPLTERRSKAVQWINTLGIDSERVWRALGIGGADDLADSHLMTLTGLRTSIKDHDVTIDEAFPDVKTLEPGQSKTKQAADAIIAAAKEGGNG